MLQAYKALRKSKERVSIAKSLNKSVNNNYDSKKVNKSAIISQPANNRNASYNLLSNNAYLKDYSVLN